MATPLARRCYLTEVGQFVLSVDVRRAAGDGVRILAVDHGRVVSIPGSARRQRAEKDTRCWRLPQETCPVSFCQVVMLPQ